MAYDETIAAAMRATLRDRPGCSERKMFGGLALMLQGNMVCGAYRDRAMFRVGKGREAAARALPGVGAPVVTGRPMTGMVEIDAAGFRDARLRERLMKLALACNAELPPK